MNSELLIRCASIENFRDEVKKAVREVLVENQSNKQIIKSEYLTIEELCDEFKFSESTVYKLTAGKKIPFIKAGKRIRFQRNAIERWLTDIGNQTHSSKDSKTYSNRQ